MKVYLIDNSNLLREEIVSSLSGIFGVDVISLSGEHAGILDVLMKEKPEMVILDVGISRQNGVKLLKKIKKKNDNTKVIFLTNFAYPLYSEMVLNSGADYYFSKFSDMNEMVNVVNTMNTFPPTVSSMH